MSGQLSRSVCWKLKLLFKLRGHALTRTQTDRHKHKERHRNSPVGRKGSPQETVCEALGMMPYRTLARALVRNILQT